MQPLVFRPLISEKSLRSASRGWYTFAIAKHSRKEQIAKDVAAMYHVDVTNVRTVAMHGKVHRRGKKMSPDKRPDWKKAMVQLKAGQKIDAFEVTSQEQTAPADAKGMVGKEAAVTKGKEHKEPKVESEKVEESKSVRSGK